MCVYVSICMLVPVLMYMLMHRYAHLEVRRQLSGVSWVMVHVFSPSIQELRKQRQEELCEFETSLVYRANFRTVSKATEKSCLKKTKTKQKANNPGMLGRP